MRLVWGEQHHRRSIRRPLISPFAVASPYQFPYNWVAWVPDKKPCLGKTLVVGNNAPSRKWFGHAGQTVLMCRAPKLRLVSCKGYQS